MSTSGHPLFAGSNVSRGASVSEGNTKLKAINATNVVIKNEHNVNAFQWHYLGCIAFNKSSSQLLIIKDGIYPKLNNEFKQ